MKKFYVTHARFSVRQIFVLLLTKNFLSLLCLALLVCMGGQLDAQVATKYTYTPNSVSATYALLSTGQTNIVTGNGTNTSNAWYQGAAANTAGAGIPIGFAFSFNCNSYTTIGVHTNGFIWFGSGNPLTTTLAPISNASANLGGTGTIDGLVAGYSGNTVTRIPFGTGSAIRYRVDGTSPNRIFKIEWLGYKMSGTFNGNATIPSTQIWLYETSNNIEFYINNMNSILINGTRTGQLGIRGTSNTDFKNCAFTTASTWANIPAGTINTQTVQTSSSPACWPNPGRMVAWTFSGSCCTQPTTQASAGSASAILSNQCDISFTRGDGASGVLVVARLNATTAVPPATNSTYTASTTFGSGATTGTNNFSVYDDVANGTGTATTDLTITNLTGGNTYAFDVYEYESGPCYKTPAYTFTVAIPVCNPPTDQADTPAVTSLMTTSATLSWNQGGGSGGDLVILSTGTITAPTQNTTYTANGVFGSGDAIGAGRVVNFDNDGTVNISNLIVNTTYNYAIYTYESTGPCYMTPPLTGSFTTANGPMTYTSSTTAQISSGVSIAQGTSNAQILQVQVVTGPGTSPALTMNSLTFNTNGSTNVATDLTAARIYYTGTSSSFATTTQFGTDVTTFPGGSTPIVVSGSQTLSAGTNYFWVVYDASISATIANLLDGECTSIDVGTTQTPTVTAPTGTRAIASIGSLSCAYTGSSQAITFTTIVGTTLPSPTLVASGAAIDDNNYTSQPIGFNFEYNGTIYTSLGINSNGFIWFGTGTPAALPTFPVISNASANLGGSGTIDGLIVACGADLWAHPHPSATPGTPQINTRVTGTAPNRIMTIEWTAFHNKSVGNNDLCWQVGSFDDHRMDFQIRLYETATGATTPGRIEMVYRDQGPFCIFVNRTIQIGMRGSSNTEFLTRANSGSLTSTSSTTGVANSTTITFANTAWFAGTNVGIRFAPNILTPAISPASTASNTCPVEDVTLTGSVPTPTSPTWQWYRNGISISGANTSTYVADTDGNYVVVASNAGCGRVCPPTAVTLLACSISITATAGANGSITPSGTISVTSGDDESFTITPDACYQVEDVLLDGVSQGAITSYTFTNVTVSHTISVSFEAIVEICNGIDDDCDTLIDEGFDVDGDGYTTCEGDCDDNDIDINPGMTEICNGIDDNCEGAIDEGFDFDGDTYTTCNGDCDDTNNEIHPFAVEICNGIDDDCDSNIDEGFDVDGDTYTTCAGDCNDANAAVFPGATEVCNGIDDDCDGTIDEGFTDADGDGYTACGGDCNDSNPSINPGEDEGCNGVDDNCDGFIDEGYDADGDGYTTCQGDCDNSNAAIHPGAVDICNSIDDDCDGIVDEGVDVDNDGFSTCEGDCDDNDNAVGLATVWYADMDGDGFGSFVYVTQCANPGISGVILQGGDCNDSNAAIYPGSAELCQNGIDDDCDAEVDEGCSGISNDNYADAQFITNNAYPQCQQIAGTCLNAAISSEGNAANVAAGGGRDVWYYFVASGTGVRIMVNPSGFDAVIELKNQLGTEINVENVAGVSQTEYLNFTGLTVGNTYFVGVRNYQNSPGGQFNICVSPLLNSFCADGSGVYDLCTNFKASWTGANNYIYHFTPTGLTPGSPVSYTGGGQIPLSIAVLGLRHSGTYTVVIDGVFNLINGLGNPETIVVSGISVCSISIAPHASVEVKLAQRCPTVLLRNTTLQGKPFVCGTLYYKIEFAEVNDCSGSVVAGIPFVVNTSGPSPTTALNFTTPFPLENGHYYRVRFKPVFNYGEGVFGNPQYIRIGGTAQGEYNDQAEGNFQTIHSLNDLASVELYPNPNDGNGFMISLNSSIEEVFTLRVYDYAGRCVEQKQILNNETGSYEIVLNTQLSSGVYMIELLLTIDNQTDRITKRLIVCK